MINKKHLRLKQTTMFLVILISFSMLGNLSVTKTEASPYEEGSWQEIAFNCKHPLLANKDFRRGLSQLVDREWIVNFWLQQNTLEGAVISPGVTVWNPALPWHNDHLQPDGDIQKGLQLIEKSGYEFKYDPEGEADLVLIVPSSNEFRISIATHIVSEWIDFGIAVDLVIINWFDDDDPCGGIVPRIFWQGALYDEDPATIIPTYYDCGYDMVLIGFGFGIPDPMTDPIIDGNFDELYTANDPENYYQYFNTNLERYYDLYIKVGGNKGLAYAIQILLQKDPPAIILYVILYE